MNTAGRLALGDAGWCEETPCRGAEPGHGPGSQCWTWGTLQEPQPKVGSERGVSCCRTSPGARPQMEGAHLTHTQAEPHQPSPHGRRSCHPQGKKPPILALLPHSSASQTRRRVGQRPSWQKGQQVKTHRDPGGPGDHRGTSSVNKVGQEDPDPPGTSAFASSTVRSRDVFRLQHDDRGADGSRVISLGQGGGRRGWTWVTSSEISAAQKSCCSRAGGGGTDPDAPSLGLGKLINFPRRPSTPL